MVHCGSGMDAKPPFSLKSGATSQMPTQIRDMPRPAPQLVRDARSVFPPTCTSQTTNAATGVPIGGNRQKKKPGTMSGLFRDCGWSFLFAHQTKMIRRVGLNDFPRHWRLIAPTAIPAEIHNPPDQVITFGQFRLSIGQSFPNGFHGQVSSRSYVIGLGVILPRSANGGIKNIHDRSPFWRNCH